MKAAIYSPYLDTLGGGERYMISIVKVLSENDYTVYIQSVDEDLLNKVQKKFGLKLNTDKIKITPDIKRGDGYDLCVWLSDGSVPLLQARKNILHFQRPFKNVDGKSILARIKFFRINTVVVNSKFTKSYIDKEFPKESIVLYPPVDTKSFSPAKTKFNTIVYVGRFSQLEQSKGQDTLAEAFKLLYKDGFKQYKLIIAGGSEVGRTSFVDELKKSAVNYPIVIEENPTFKTIQNHYSRAKLFWSAAGYGVNQEKHPEKLEHFGMTVAEAMAAGAVPVIFNAGGHKEIINNSESGYTWDTIEELVKYSKELLLDNHLRQKMQSRATTDAENFSYQEFEKQLLSIISSNK